MSYGVHFVCCLLWGVGPNTSYSYRYLHTCFLPTPKRASRLILFHLAHTLPHRLFRPLLAAWLMIKFLSGRIASTARRPSDRSGTSGPDSTA